MADVNVLDLSEVTPGSGDNLILFDRSTGVANSTRFDVLKSEVKGNIDSEIQTLTNQIKVGVYNHVEKFELDNTGVNDCAEKLENVTDNIGLKAGIYKIASDCTINAQVVMAKGARFDIDSGVTLTINGQILAGRYRIFSGNGDVVVNENYQDFGYPEWFNNDIAKTCSVFRHVKLAPKVYTLNSTLELKTSNSCIEGECYSTNLTGDAATLRFTSGNLKVGRDDTTAVNDFPRNITVKNLNLDIMESGISCVDVYGVVRPNFENVYIYTQTGGSGVTFRRSIGGLFHNVYVQSVGITGTFFGFRFIDESNTGVVGARSASNWLSNCTYTDTERNGGNTFGFRIEKGNSDVFIDNCEVAIAKVGLSIYGLDSEVSTNIRISNCDFDSCDDHSIYLNNCSKGQINIVNIYCANAATGSGTSTILIAGSTATVILDDIQAIITKNNTTGILFSAGSSALVHSLSIVDGSGVSGTTPVNKQGSTNVAGDYIFNGVIGTI